MTIPPSDEPDANPRSRPLDVHRHSDYPEVKEFVSTFWAQHLQERFPAPSKGRRAGKKPKEIFKVLFLDLYIAWLEEPSMHLSISRTKAEYGKNTRYRNIHIPYKLVEIVDALIELGFLGQKLGSEAARKITRIWALEPLKEYFRTAAFSEFMIEPHHHKECIVLRAAQPQHESGKFAKTSWEIDYIDSDAPFDVSLEREQLRSYNDLLMKTHIDIPSQDQPVVTRSNYNRATRTHETQYISLRHDNKFVRRIFYRGNWRLGGRYHGGWWQQIPSELRKDILIDDQHTVEVDFSGFHISIAYALEGLKPPKDPYTLEAAISSLKPAQQRSAVKQLVLTAINARDRKSAFQAFRKEINEKQLLLSTDEKIRYTDELLEEMLNRFIDQNKPIEKYLCADKGVEFMAIDGNITARVINHFTNQGIVVLTIHDSYIIQSQHEQKLIDYMDYATKTVMGDFHFNKKQEKPSPRMVEIFTRMDKSINAMAMYEDINNSIQRTQGYRVRLERFGRYWAEDNRSL